MTQRNLTPLQQTFFDALQKVTERYLNSDLEWLDAYEVIEMFYHNNKHLGKTGE